MGSSRWWWRDRGSAFAISTTRVAGVIGLDTNLAIDAHHEDSAWRAEAYQAVAGLAEGTSPWTIPWPCVHEFLAIVTHRRIYNPPTPLAALDQIGVWLESPTLVVLTESTGYWATLRDMLGVSRVVGRAIHDARVAAICRLHGVRELWTADRDFGRFAGLHTRNPLVGREGKNALNACRQPSPSGITVCIINRPCAYRGGDPKLTYP